MKIKEICMAAAEEYFKNIEAVHSGSLEVRLAENKEESLEKTDKLDEVTLTITDNSDILKLKQPNEVYMEIYQEVRRRAKTARQKAIEAYLEVKRIKSLYMLEEIEDSEDDDDILESFEEEGELNQ